MRPRHPLPQRWLMTDERMGDSLWAALERLPRGSGVVFRHYGLSPAERRALFAHVARVARRRGLLLLRAGAERFGRDEAGVHGLRGHGLRTYPAHSRREAVQAIRAGADALFELAELLQPGFDDAQIVHAAVEIDRGRQVHDGD